MEIGIGYYYNSLVIQHTLHAVSCSHPRSRITEGPALLTLDFRYLMALVG